MHVCEFCNDKRGNGEIHVKGSHGYKFVAPSMLIHYIEEHGYKPPDVFIDAVNGVTHEKFNISIWERKRNKEALCVNQWAKDNAKLIREEIDNEIISDLMQLNK